MPQDVRIVPVPGLYSLDNIYNLLSPSPHPLSAMVLTVMSLIYILPRLSLESVDGFTQA